MHPSFLPKNKPPDLLLLFMYIGILTCFFYPWRAGFFHNKSFSNNFPPAPEGRFETSRGGPGRSDHWSPVEKQPWDGPPASPRDPGDATLGTVLRATLGTVLRVRFDPGTRTVGTVELHKI